MTICLEENSELRISLKYNKRRYNPLNQREILFVNRVCGRHLPSCRNFFRLIQSQWAFPTAAIVINSVSTPFGQFYQYEYVKTVVLGN